MKYRKIVPYVLIAVSAALAVISFLVLPDEVIIQFSVGAGANTIAPKLLAVLIPSAIGIGGAVFGLLAGENEKSWTKSIVASVVGVIVFIIMLAVNTAGAI